MKKVLFSALFSLLFVSTYSQKLDSIFQAEIAHFTDSLVTGLMKKNIAGATVSVVKDGEIIHLQGYGKVDVENGVDVDPERHLFRIGSISKIFVWTAIMQLVEQGKINLNDDINQYLGLEIPDTYEAPITIKNLMTHTPGFEDRLIGLFARDASALQPIADILTDEMPQRAFPAGTASSYSNHGTGMAQLIVERVSGLNFHEYVAQYILEPLEMQKTTFHQPVPAELQNDLSKGYLHADNSFTEMDFEYVPLYGVGACSSTATDMAHFMMAHLQLGAYNASQILDSATAELMQSPAFYNHPKVNPMRYGFMDVSQNGITIIGHGGDTMWFHSFMALYPEANLGVFISLNSQAGGAAAMKFVEHFTDRFFPESVETIAPSLDQKALAEYAGFYTSNRYPRSTMAKLGKLAISGNLEATTEGTLKTNFLGMEKHWIPVDEEVFRNRETSEILVFSKNDAGKVSNLYIDTLPIVVMEKATGFDHPLFHMITIGLVVLLVLITGAISIIRFLIKGSKRSGTGRLSRNSRRIISLVNSCWFLFFLTLIISIAMDPMGFIFEVPVLMKFSLVFPVVVALLLIPMAYFTFVAWSNREIRMVNKVYLSTLFVVYTTGIWVTNYWNLLGFKY